MKKILKVIGVALCLVAFTQNTNAQVNFSGGVELAMPMGDMGKSFGFGYGVSFAAEKPIGDNMGITGTLGYLIFPWKSDAFGSGVTVSGTSAFMPIQAGFKYYFTDNTSGGYAKADLGFHRNSGSFNGSSYSNTDLSYAIGGGYLINEKIDLGLRYQMIATDGSSSAYLGVRAAYQF